jgi:integrase
MLKQPPYKCGVSVKCLQCKCNVTDKCGLTKKNVKYCQHIDKHRYNLTVCIPGTENKRRLKILDTTNFETALIEMQKFRSELKTQGYHKVKTNTKSVTAPTLLDFATAYLNSMSGENTPAILIRLKSQSHIDDCQRAIFRFGMVLKKAGYCYETIKLEEISDTEVSLYHEYLLNELKLKPRTYNKHIAAMRTLYTWATRVKDYKGSNPFNHVELRNQITKEKNIITKEEFDKLLSVVKYENGFDARNKNLYKDWLPAAYRLAVETGLRREELMTLKYSDVVQLDNNKLVFRISNLKVNRIRNGEDDGNYIKNIPVTKSLMQLLMDLGYSEKQNTDAYIIDRQEGTELSYMMDLLSRSFTHFIKLATNRKIEFKDLRKTYITHLTMALGSNSKIFTGHSNDDILKVSYLSNAFMAGKLSDFKMF